METKKKNRKLLIQVALVTIPLFFLMIAAVVTVMYKNTVDSFLEIQNDVISETLEKMYYNAVDFDDSFLLDYWQENPELSVKTPDLPSDKKQKIWNEMLNHEEKSYDWLSSKTPEEKQYVAYTMYSLSMLTGDEFNSAKEKYDEVFLIDINEPNVGFVFFEWNSSGDSKKLGDKIEFELSDHKVLEDMLNKDSSDIVYEKTTDFMGEGRRYIGYKPVVIDGKVRAVLGISYSWKEFSKLMTKNLWKTLIVGNAFIIVLMIAIIVFLYRKAIKPVGRIQKSVCEYIGTKDSRKVTEDMSRIKTNNEIGLLSDNISELAEEIDNYTAENIRLAGERERVAAELDMATKIQTSQLPCSFPAFPDRNEFDIYASMSPAKEVGGDFYDFFFIDSDHLALVIADVSGKGVPAALFMMMSKILINNYAMMGQTASEVLESLNNTICKNNNNQMFVTVWYGVLEISTGKVTAVNAGHEYPIIRQPGGEFELFKDKHGLVAGAMGEIPYASYEFTLQKGSTLFLYTDGVPEATRADKTMFKVEGLVKALNEQPDASPKQLLENVRRAVDDFVGDEPQFDDLTMLGITLL